MSSNRAKNSKPELLLRRALWASGLRGYRLHYKKVPGRPDISFVSKKIAIFVHGCFWHRCPKCEYNMPKTNTEFWRSKFDRNTARDVRKAEDLKAIGWNVLTIWECGLKTDLQSVINKINQAYKQAAN